MMAVKRDQPVVRRCKLCRQPIGEKRLAALPFTRVCVGCSTEQPVRGHMITPHKTGSHIEILTSAQSAEVKRHDSRRAYGANLPTESKRT